jgi:aerobic carbon-monoxide dehydrogenase medium subunit
MKPAAFSYHAPTELAEAVALLAELGEDAKAIAGGQSLVPLLALRLAAPQHLVDLGRLVELRGVEERADGLWIGAGTTQARIERCGQVAEAAPLLARATPLIGHFQIRNRGTLGGSLAHADAAAEYPAVALTLDARLHAYSPRGPRDIAADRFFTGIWTTDLAPDEVLTGVTFPRWSGRRGLAIEEFSRRHGDFAIAGATVAVELDTVDSGDRIRRCAIGLFGMGPTPLRASAAEASLLGRAAGDLSAGEIGQLAVRDLDAVTADPHASADYRTHVGAVMVSRAWRRALEEAGRA